MSAYTYLALGQAGLGFLEGATAPDAPNIKPYEPTPLESRSVSDFVPEADALMGAQSDMALAMMEGKIPDSVKDQVMAFAGERAMRGGYGASESRVMNMTMRDLGLESLGYMSQGFDMSTSLIRQGRDLMSDELAIEISNANMAYDAYASNVQIQMDNWRGEREQHANMFGNIISAGSMGVQGYYNQKNEDRYYDLMSKAIA